MRRRILSILIVLCMVVPTVTLAKSGPATGQMSEPASSITSIPGAIKLDGSQDYEMIEDVLSQSPLTIEGLKFDEIVEFIVELESDSLLEAAPARQNITDFIDSGKGKIAMQRIEREQASVLNALKDIETDSGLAIEIDYTYSLVLNGFAVNAPYSALTKLASIPGVKSVTVAQTYDYVDPSAGYTQAIHTSGSMINSDSANREGFTGKGTVTAILDTGLETSHEAFQRDPENPAMTVTDIGEVVSGGKLNANVTATELYVSSKIPFAYDYADSDNDVSPAADGTADVSHGTHVAGTVGADSDNLTGVAPDTQLVICKVFSDYSSGANDSDIFAALEDCVLLGVEIINMSLGSPSGFTSADELTNAVYERVKNAGINLMAAAGNDYEATHNNNLGTGLPLITEPDNAIVNSPSTYAAAMSVASVNENTMYARYFIAGGEKILYTDPNTDDLSFSTALNGKTIPFVVVPNFGEESDFATVDVSEKVALVARGGGVTFTAKEANALNAGAVAVIVYDNVDGDLVNMATEGLLPMIFISRADGNALRKLETKEIDVSSSYQDYMSYSAAGLMSDFSSLGVAPDLTLKPEITAPGGNVYSTLPGNTYGNYSGTSMASPHMAGAASILYQYVHENFSGLSANDEQILINTLLMNTAIPLVDEYGVTYCPRKQGAGLAEVSNAIHTNAYVTVNGNERPKAELGDSDNGYFSKTFTLTIHNISDDQMTYEMSAIPLTAQEVEIDGLKFISDYERELTSDEFQVSFSWDTVTVPAQGTAEVIVKLRLTETGAASLKNFRNGTFLDGFIVLESQSDGIDLSVPYLGFYGDWSSASIFDNSIYEDEDASVFASFMGLFSLVDGTGYYLGNNIFAYSESNAIDLYGNKATNEIYDADKIAASMDIVNNPDYYYRPFACLGLLRAPKSLTYTITDSDGNPLELFYEGDYSSLGYSHTVENVVKSFYYASGDFINYEMGPTYYGWLPAYLGEDDYFHYLPDSDYTINVSAKIDSDTSDNNVQTTSFPISIDSESPKLVSHVYEEIDGVPYLTLNITDNNYAMGFQMVDDSMENALSPVYVVNEDERGAVSSITFDVSLLQELGYERARLVIYDYALNGTTTDLFSLISQDLQPSVVRINNRDITQSGASTFEINAYLDPEDCVDTELTWTSDNPKVATVVGLDKTYYVKEINHTFYCAKVTTSNVAGVANITVETVNGHSDTTTVTVNEYVDAWPSDNVIRKDGYYVVPEDLNAQVTITDEARNVTLQGHDANTEANPYQDLYIFSEISDGLNLTISNLKVVTTKSSKSTPVIEFTGSGNRLYVTGDNTFTNNPYSSDALVKVQDTTELTVDGTGTLNLNLVVSGNGAGIGSRNGQDAGVIVIDGATLKIVNAGYGAGIGGGMGGGAPSITINGGIINVDVPYAEGSWTNNLSACGAGIGSGQSSGSRVVNITINGGNITGTTEVAAALIGTGYVSFPQSSDKTPTITINGGKLDVTSATNSNSSVYAGAAIGTCSQGASAGSITINGGEVRALTTTGAAAIGGGYRSGYYATGIISVNGGTVSAFTNCANTNYNGPAIGAGASSKYPGYVLISAGAVLTDYYSSDPTSGTINYTGSIQNDDFDNVYCVQFGYGNVTSVMVDGVDWKVPVNHSNPDSWSTDYSAEVDLWLTIGSHIVVLTTESGVEKCEVTVRGDGDWEWYEYHDVTYDLSNLTTDGANKVYDANETDVCGALTGTLQVTGDNYNLPEFITVTVNGVDVPVTYDSESGIFCVDVQYLIGDVVVTASAVEIVDKTELENLIKQVEEMDSAMYTPVSWSAVDAALSIAREVAAADNTTQIAIDDAAAALRNALEALVIIPDISELEAAIAEANLLVESDYMSDTWVELAEALATAVAVATDPNAMEEEVAAALDRLNNAISALVHRADKSALKSAIDIADVLFECDYSPSSWVASGIEEALATAIDVYTTPDATQDQVDAATAALNAAITRLTGTGDSSTLHRISGANRYATAVAISKEGWNSSDIVVLARGDNYADALAGVPLAYAYNAPILLTAPNRLNPSTREEIVRLGASKVVILGGEGAVSESVTQILRDELHAEVERISGKNRFATAAEVARRLVEISGPAEKAVLAYGLDFPDALAAASYAAVEGYPILLVRTDVLTGHTDTVIAELGIQDFVVVGGSSVISDELMNQLGSATRVAGSNRYATAVELAKYFAPTSSEVYLATGQDFADAITGGVLAAKNNSGLLLVHSNRVAGSVQDYIVESSYKWASIFGGTGVVDDGVVSIIEELFAR